MLIPFLAGALIALSFSAPPGPVLMETLRRGLRGGFGPALRVQLGSILGDTLWCGAALLGLAPWVQVAWVRVLLSVSGVAVLVYLGVTGVREAFKPLILNPESSKHIQHGAFRAGVWISMANPLAVGYWVGLGGALAAAGFVGQEISSTIAFMTGFVGAVLAWSFLMASAVRWGQRFLTPMLFRWLSGACGLTLLTFGVALAAHMLGVGL